MKMTVSKTDKRNRGFKILIGCTEQKVCAYCAMKSFFTEKMLFEKDKPLFLYKNGVVLSRHILKNQPLFRYKNGVLLSRHILKNQPLFLYKNGVVLSRHILRANTELYVSLIGVDSKQYSGHSYIIGGATTMAEAGMSDWEIKLSGRRSSSAYQHYIGTPSSYRI